MTYQVLARKWRPPRFSEVVGQQTVTRTLENAIKTGRVAHAFLFSGVRGVGKTTTARILAKALNCHRGLTPEPCGECPSCKEIAASNSVDVQEIDGASNNSVDNVRDIRESVQYGPARDRFKIYIIDEVHMLSMPAFNALLKTLEEPPPHVKFILATTEFNKIPITITSRCQQFDFKPIPFALVLERLRLICREEGIEISEYGLRTIASAASGSMRDGQSTLDQIISLSGQKVSDEDIRALLGVVDDKVMVSLVDSVCDRDREKLLATMQELVDSGVDPQAFCRKFIAHLRNLLVCRVAGWSEQLLSLPDSEKDVLLAQAKRFTELELIRFYDLLSHAENELRFHPHPYVHIEMTLMKLVELAQLPALETVLERLRQGADSTSVSAPAATQTSPKPAKPAPPRSASPPASSPARAVASPPKQRSLTASRGPVSAAVQPDDEKSPEPEQTPVGEKDPQRVLDYLRQALQKEGMRVFSSLQHASAVTLEENRLKVVFAASEGIHYSIVNDQDARNLLAEVCARISGSKPEVTVLKADQAEAKAEADPTKDPKFKTFFEVFPGKYEVKDLKKRPSAPDARTSAAVDPKSED